MNGAALVLAKRQFASSRKLPAHVRRQQELDAIEDYVRAGKHTRCPPREHALTPAQDAATRWGRRVDDLEPFRRAAANDS